MSIAAKKGTFFSQTNCDRCGKELTLSRTLSWFNEETICMECSANEHVIRSKLPNYGKEYEGVGYVPKV